VIGSFGSKALTRASVRGVEAPLYPAFTVTSAWLDR
jgi:hypothetical protein